MNFFIVASVLCAVCFSIFSIIKQIKKDAAKLAVDDIVIKLSEIAEKEANDLSSLKKSIEKKYDETKIPASFTSDIIILPKNERKKRQKTKH